MIRIALLLTILWGVAARAEVPRVVVDIAPVHALVAQVMDGVGTPELILPPGASPHGYALRPSQARAVEQADVVIWIGPDLAPWLVGPLDALAPDAARLTLMDVPQSLVLEVRTDAAFDGGHDEAEAGHDHGHAHDPHAWLAPENAALWMLETARVLGATDPDNALKYQANAQDAAARLARLGDRIEGILAPVRGQPFVVYHDGYQYFEHSFGFPAAGALSVHDAARPSAARVAQIAAMIEDAGAVCVLSEPQFNAGLIAAVGAPRTGVADPLGAGLIPGPMLYETMMITLAEALADCLGAGD